MRLWLRTRNAQCPASVYQHGQAFLLRTALRPQGNREGLPRQVPAEVHVSTQPKAKFRSFPAASAALQGRIARRRIRISLAVAAILVFAAPPTQAQDQLYDWSVLSGDWSVATNWGGTRPPPRTTRMSSTAEPNDHVARRRLQLPLSRRSEQHELRHDRNVRRRPRGVLRVLGKQRRGRFPSREGPTLLASL